MGNFSQFFLNKLILTKLKKRILIIIIFHFIGENLILLIVSFKVYYCLYIEEAGHKCLHLFIEKTSNTHPTTQLPVFS